MLVLVLVLVLEANTRTRTRTRGLILVLVLVLEKVRTRPSLLRYISENKLHQESEEKIFHLFNYRYRHRLLLETVYSS
jgi:hypothetical protein